MPTRGQPSDCILSFLYYAARRMSSWNPLFRIGYYFYTKTHIGYWSFMRIIKKAHVKFDKGGHSTAPPTVWNGLRIVPIPIAFDNYGYLVVDERTNTSVLIDPSDPLVVQEFLERENTTPVAILATHRHWDHTAGNYELKKLYPGLQVYGGHISPIQGITDIVHDGDHLTFGSLSFCVFHTPGHTMEHVVYILDGAPFGMSPSIFSGDHLFLAGIGRLFEGTAKTMMESLERLCALPDDTLLWPGHEYALDNIGYAFYLEPENEAVRNKYMWVKDMRSTRQCTCPSTMKEEKAYNPFLRVNQESVMKSLGLKFDPKKDTKEQTARALFVCQTRRSSVNQVR